MCIYAGLVHCGGSKGRSERSILDVESGGNFDLIKPSTKQASCLNVVFSRRTLIV